MNNPPRLPILATLALLLIAAAALVAGIQSSVLDVAEAAFMPVAAFAVIFGYLIGSKKISPRRAWILLILAGLFVIYFEAARLNGSLIALVKGLPTFEFETVRSLLKKETPDLSFLQVQAGELAKQSAGFFTRLLSKTDKNPTVREVTWDLPLLLICSWAGWWTARKRQILPALLPSLVLNGYLVYYTGQGAFSLQIGIFALILLMGIGQGWTAGITDSAKVRQALQDSYLTILIFSLVLAFGAGLAPSISVRDIAQKITKKDSLANSLGLDRTVQQSYATSTLPREHLIGLDPSNSQRIVFKVKTGEAIPFRDEGPPPAPPRHYWRWLVYDVYTGKGWATSSAENVSLPADSSLFTLHNDQYKIIHQQVEKEFPQDNHLYWTGTLMRADQTIEATWRTPPETVQPTSNPLLGMDMLGALTNYQTYSADSLVPIVSQEELRASDQNYPATIAQRYLSLPDIISQRVLQLSTDLTQNIDNPYDQAKAIEAYLRTYPYTLDVPPPPTDREIADYFLFDLKTGYCDYYATAMIVLARAAGLPARLVIGYASGSYDRTTAEYHVREADAHSWVEVYFTGIGWVEFEPTANRPVIELPKNLSRPNHQTNAPNFSREQATYLKKGFVPRRNPTPIIIGGMATLLLAGLWLHAQGLLTAHKTVGSIYDHVYRHGRRIYRDAAINETPSIFAGKLQKKLQANHRILLPAPDEINLITQLYLQETYSAHPVARAERRKAIQAWEKLFWRLLYARVMHLK